MTVDSPRAFLLDVVNRAIVINCDNCVGDAFPCNEHIVEAILDAVRNEQLFIMTNESTGEVVDHCAARIYDKLRTVAAEFADLGMSVPIASIGLATGRAGQAMYRLSLTEVAQLAARQALNVPDTPADRQPFDVYRQDLADAEQLAVTCDRMLRFLDNADSAMGLSPAADQLGMQKTRAAVARQLERAARRDAAGVALAYQVGAPPPPSPVASALAAATAERPTVEAAGERVRIRVPGGDRGLRILRAIVAGAVLRFGNGESRMYEADGTYTIVNQVLGEFEPNGWAYIGEALPERAVLLPPAGGDLVWGVFAGDVETRPAGAILLPAGARAWLPTGKAHEALLRDGLTREQTGGRDGAAG